MVNGSCLTCTTPGVYNGTFILDWVGSCTWISPIVLDPCELIASNYSYWSASLALVAGVYVLTISKVASGSIFLTFQNYFQITFISLPDCLDWNSLNVPIVAAPPGGWICNPKAATCNLTALAC
jgi:hypothetical protein